tara:strand:+ start:3818 stop:4300 length:483 start_codon:yes stop_codon:yes gene_type:complete
MKNLVIIVLFLITNTFSIQAQKEEWKSDTIFELRFDAISEIHKPVFVTDVNANLKFYVDDNDLSKGKIVVEIKGYEKLDAFLKKSIVSKSSAKKTHYVIHINQCHIFEDRCEYYNYNGEDKVVIYMDEEGMMKDTWHFTAWDEDLEVYTESRYFCIYERP